MQRGRSSFRTYLEAPWHDGTIQIFLLKESTLSETICNRWQIPKVERHRTIYEAYEISMGGELHSGHLKRLANNLLPDHEFSTSNKRTKRGIHDLFRLRLFSFYTCRFHHHHEVFILFSFDFAYTHFPWGADGEIHERLISSALFVEYPSVCCFSPLLHMEGGTT